MSDDRYYKRLEDLTPKEQEAELERLREKFAGLLPKDEKPWPEFMDPAEAARIKRECIEKHGKCKRCLYESKINKGRCIFKIRPALWVR